MWNKRGVSTVVATLLIVLITIAAAAILVGVIIPFVTDSLEGSTECIPYQNHLQFEEEMGFTCYEQSNLTGFSVRVNAPESNAPALDRFDVTFAAARSLRRATVTNQTSASSAPEGIRMLGVSGGTLAMPKIGEVMTYVYNGAGIRPETIEIYPVLANGKICPASDTIELVSCKGAVLS